MNELRPAAVCVALGAALLSTGLQGAAAAAPATSETFRGHHVPFTEPSRGVCDGQPGTLTETVNFVVHSTTGPRTTTSNVHVSSRFTFAYDDVSRPVFTGQYAFSSNNVVSTGSTISKEVLNARSTGSDGSTELFHMNVVLVTSPDGTVRSEVSNIFCR